jgi:arabinofuranan 3-O-arabinosyltransferase
VTVSGVDARSTIDRRYGDPRTLPAAIAELTGTEGIAAVTVDRAAEFSAECATGLLEVDGRPVPLSFAATAGSLLDGEPFEATACTALTLDPGEHDLVAPSTTGLVVDRVLLAEATVPAPAAPDTLVPIELTEHEPRRREVVVDACPDGCWVVLGEGFNDAWAAEADGTSLGAPVLVDGGFNGWWLAPTTEPTSITFRWTAQGPVTAGLAISGAAVLVCLLMVALARRRPVAPLDRPQLTGAVAGIAGDGAWWAAGSLVVASGLFIGPTWAAVALVPALLVVLAATRRVPALRFLEATGVLAAAAVALSVMWITRRDRPFPDAGWTLAYDHLHGLAVFAVLAVAAGAAFAPDARSETSTDARVAGDEV